VKTISIEGFDRIGPNNGFTLAVFGPDFGGKTRLIAQAQAEAYMEDMETGVIVLDAKTRTTLKAECERLGVPLPLTNKRDYVTPQDAMKMALLDETSNEGKKAVMEFYAGVVDRIFADAVKLAEHKGIMTVSVDPFTEFYDYMFYATFGRKTQIPAISRTPVNQWAIDFIKSIKHKNVILTHRQSEVWKDTGRKDKEGNAIKEPSGRFTLSGYKDIGYQVSAMLQMKVDKKLEGLERFSVDVIDAQLRADLAGMKGWLTGEEITWAKIKGELWNNE
jgi:hypothetical protein